MVGSRPSGANVPRGLGHPLEGCLAKLHRAKAHLDALEEASGEFRRGSEPVRLVREDKAEGSLVEFIYRAKISAQPPLSMSVLVGDALYNLHSALDHLAWQLALLGSHPATPPTGSTFPIFRNRGRFWRTDTRTGNYTPWSGARRIAAMPDDAQALIVELQPYCRGDDAIDHPLWLLHELSNTDKHSTLHLAVSALTGKRLSVPKGSEHLRIDSFEAFPGLLHDGAVLGRVRASLTDEAEVEIYPECSFNEAFSEAGPAKGMLVMTTLGGILNYISDEVLSSRFLPYFARDRRRK